MSRPMDGLRVLDFSHVLAGPFATRLLADMGADVVRVSSESRATGGHDPAAVYYIMWNRNKRSLSLDMTRDESKSLARELVHTADVVIDNFSPGVLERWGIGYDSVSQSNEGVIYVEMSGMGDTGPWAKFVTYAPTIHALSGLSHLTGVPGREDIGIGFSYNDHQAGLHGAVAILAALEARRRTGHGQRVDISQFEVGVNFCGPTLMDLFANGHAARPTGNDLPYDRAAPHGCYRCADEAKETVDERWVAIACMDDSQWLSLRKVMGNPDWADDEKLSTVAGRLGEQRSLDDNIAKWTRTLDATIVMERCQQAGVPAGVVQNSIDLVERDPQLEHAGFLNAQTELHPKAGQTYYDRLAMRFSKTPCEDYSMVSGLGEDNASVLKDWLDMSADEVREGEESGYLS